MLLPGLLFAAGLFLVVRGGDLFVGAAAWMAEVLGIPKFVVGATVVSLATTLPEILVSLFAALSGSVEMAVGNAMGTVAVNAGLVLGIAMLCCPVKLADFESKAALMLVAAVLLAAFGSTGRIDAIASALLFLLLVAFAAESVRAGRDGRGERRAQRPGRTEISRNAAGFLFGAAGIAVGAQLMVLQGQGIARALGVREGVIGVALMGLGTSLPELATTVAALRRKEAALSIGNVIGASVIDLTLILPLCALASGEALPIGEVARTLDLPALGAIAAVAVVPTVLAKRTRRAQGIALIALYAAYLALVLLR